MTLVVFYLSGYKSEFRQEYDINPSDKKEVENARSHFIERYGSKWKSSTKDNVKFDKPRIIKKKAKIKPIKITKSYTRLIRGKPTEVKPYERTFTKWNKSQESNIALLYSQGTSLKSISKYFNKTESSIRTKMSRLKVKRMKISKKG